MSTVFSPMLAFRCISIAMAVEIRCTVHGEGVRSNGLHYDPSAGRPFIVDQGDGDPITIDDPHGAGRESVFHANSGKPSSVAHTEFGSQDTIVMASTYKLVLTQARDGKIIEVDVHGFDTSISISPKTSPTPPTSAITASNETVSICGLRPARQDDL